MYKEEDELYKIFVEHLERTYGEEWIVVVALKARIGIHHGLIPKYIQKEIINLFGRGQLVCLFSTTTITEGVNTPAKNIIITSLKKGKKDLKQFIGDINIIFIYIVRTSFTNLIILFAYNFKLIILKYLKIIFFSKFQKRIICFIII